MTESAGEDDLIILLLSKGTAEILESLPDTVSVSDYTNLLKTLKSSGARKEEINAVKTHMSRTKGGQFLNFSHPASLISVIVSDEPGGDIWRTYQSPTYTDQTTFDDCRRILIRYRLPLKLPPSILNHFNLGIRKKIPETIKEGDEKLIKVLNYVIQHSSSFAADALSAAEQAGLSASILSTRLEGDAEQLGKFFGNIIKDIAEFNIPLEAPCAFIAAGKTDHSEEMRLEEICALAMSCAIQIDGIERAWFLAGSSFNFEDGGSVGVVVNCSTVNEVRESGADPLDLIRERKAHTFFKDRKMLLTGKPNLIDCGDLYIMMVV
jgi:glycerate-2-kinase